MSTPFLPAGRVPFSPVHEKRQLVPQLVVPPNRWPPTPQGSPGQVHTPAAPPFGAIVRAPSWEGPIGSRCPSPGPHMPPVRPGRQAPCPTPRYEPVVTGANSGAATPVFLTPTVPSPFYLGQVQAPAARSASVDRTPSLPGSGPLAVSFSARAMSTSAIPMMTPPAASPSPPPGMPREPLPSAQQAPDHEDSNLSRQMLQDLLGHVREMAVRQTEIAAASVRKGYHEKEELQSQLLTKEQKIKEIDEQLQKTLEELQQKSSDLVRASESEAEAKQRLEREKLRHDSAGEELTVRYQELERSKDDLEERMRQVVGLKGQLEAAKDEAEKRETASITQCERAQEAIRRLQSDLGDIRSEFAAASQQREEAERVRIGVERETKDLRIRAALLEDQLRDAHDKLQQERWHAEQERQRAERVEHDQERLPQDASQWGSPQLQESLTVQRRINADLKCEVCRLERMLAQERATHSIMSPADFFALHQKQAEGERGLVSDNELLRRQLMKTQCDLEDTVNRLQEAQAQLREARGGAAMAAVASGGAP